MEIDLNDTYWERLSGYVTESRVDGRWILKSNINNKPYGSLRIVSHPDLKPGYLRAFYTFVKSVRPKSKTEKLKTIEDYCMDNIDIEVYSVDEKVESETVIFEKTHRELNEMFGVNIFEK